MDGEQVTLAATDRYRLAVRSFAWTPKVPDFSAAAHSRAPSMHARAGLVAATRARLGMLGFFRQRQSDQCIEGEAN